MLVGPFDMHVNDSLLGAQTRVSGACQYYFENIDKKIEMVIGHRFSILCVEFHY
jgi:hypothetical protein